MTPNYRRFLLLGINPAGEVAMVKFFKAEHHYSRVFTTIIACLISDLSEPVLADESPVWKVEEDWELKTYQSDPSIFSPQITFFSTPDDADTETYFQLQMNYSADNNFSAGGFQVAAVKGGSTVDEERSDQQITLSLVSDCIRWTNVMAFVNSKLLFAVKDGYGQEWGSFGGPEYLVQIEGVAADHLNHYSITSSLQSVDIGFGKNRIESIVLKRVRRFRIDGTIETVELDQSP